MIKALSRLRAQEVAGKVYKDVNELRMKLRSLRIGDTVSNDPQVFIIDKGYIVRHGGGVSITQVDIGGKEVTVQINGTQQLDLLKQALK